MINETIDSTLIQSDFQIRLRALDPKQSFIVQAPAGSGKTGLLTQRFLVLLAEASRAPEECLAITFTRKAAAEMKERVLNALQRAEDPKPPLNAYEHQTWLLAQKVCARDKTLGWDLLNNPNRLRIQTIDALCLSLIRQMPIMSQLGSVPEIIEDADHLYQIAARNFLKHLEYHEPWSREVALLLEHLDNNLVLAEKLLKALLPHRDQWLPNMGKTEVQAQLDARQYLESNLKGIVTETLIALVQSIPEDFEIIRELVQFSAHHCALLHLESPIQKCKILKTWPGSTLEDIPLWEGLCELLLTKEYAWRKTVTEQQGFPAPSGTKDKDDKLYFQTMKKRMCEYLSGCEKFSLFREQLQKFCECPPIEYSDHQWNMIQTLVKLLPLLIAELSLVFQEQGQIDFTEVSLRALKALGDWDEPTDLALGLDYKISHILVDEFQDTSLTQFRLLEQLTAGWQSNEGKTLFLVGDPMQSIYRFRQAEVGLFIRAKQKGIGFVSLKSLSLTTNFRSEPEIVDWFNHRFNILFPKQDDMASSAIQFSPSVAALKTPLKEKLTEDKAIAHIEAVTLETEASVVVDLIQSVHQSIYTHKQNASIAILVRSRSHLHSILPALKKAQIDYQGVQLETLIDHMIVQDLLSLTLALLHLGDRIAWLALLRSPIAALSLNDLWIIANKDIKFPIWHNLQSFLKDLECSDFQQLSPLAKDCLREIVPILDRALAERGRLSLRAWVMETWLALGGASIYGTDTDIHQNHLKYAEAFFAVLEEEKQFNFYEVGVLEKRLHSLFAESEISNPEAVQIMTIHKAKGLEFDTVIVPGVGRKTLHDPSKLLLWETRAGLLKESYLVLAPISSVGSEKDPIYRYLRRQEEIRAKHEEVRLWYVAATRARKRLYWLTHDK